MFRNAVAHTFQLKVSTCFSGFSFYVSSGYFLYFCISKLNLVISRRHLGDINSKKETEKAFNVCFVILVFRYRFLFSVSYNCKGNLENQRSRSDVPVLLIQLLQDTTSSSVLSLRLLDLHYDFLPLLLSDLKSFSSSNEGFDHSDIPNFLSLVLSFTIGLRESFLKLLFLVIAIILRLLQVARHEKCEYTFQE